MNKPPKSLLMPDAYLKDEITYLDDNFKVVNKEQATIVRIVKNGILTFGVIELPQEEQSNDVQAAE